MGYLDQEAQPQPVTAIGYAPYIPNPYTPLPPESYFSSTAGSFQPFPPQPPSSGLRFWLPRAEPPPQPWRHGLCSCCKDVLLCRDLELHATTCFCPCITFGRNAEMIDDGYTSCPNSAAVWYLLQQVTCFGCLYSCLYRQRLRRKYNIKEGRCPDCCVHFCCPLCAFCQEHKELVSRGMNPYLGWPAGVALMAPAPLYMQA